MEVKKVEPINQTINRLSRKPSFQQRYEQLKAEVLKEKQIQQFIQENEARLTDQIIEAHLMKLYEYMTQTKNCRDCSSLEHCSNLMKGYEPMLVVEGQAVHIHYRACQKKVAEDEKKKTKKLIQSFYVPKDILQASFAHFTLDSPGRIDAFEYAEQFAAKYEVGSTMKGLYLYGSFGVGKSYLLGAIANELKKKGISTYIVYMPEFFREMKQSLGDQTLNEKLHVVKTAPVLMLDDIGAEAMSSWTRDDILGSILQFRMQEGLPTFFTSNFDFDGLLHHLTYSQRGEEEKMKAARLMERIKYLAIPIKLDGPNRRHM